MYTALGIIFLIVLILMAALIVFTTVRAVRGGGEVLTKKNMLYLAPTFIILYALFLTASVFKDGKVDFFYCFALVNKILETLKFKADNSIIYPICREFPLFYADFVMAYLLGAATVILSIASLFGRRLSNFVRVKNALRKNCDIVVGETPLAEQYVKTAKSGLLLAPNISNQKYTEIMRKRIPVLRMPLSAAPLSRKLKRGGYNVIVFRGENYAYSKIIETFTRLSAKVRVKIYLEANQQEMKILKEKFISKADDNSDLYVAGFSKYELMARRFVADEPITKYIPRSFFNDNFTVKNDKQINVVFVGFGKVNYQLFRMCAMQFQFAQQTDGKLSSKPVKYYIYDSHAAMLHNEFFSRILFEFDEDFADCDFPKPEKICDLEIFNTDINSIEAKKHFKSLVHKDSFTYFVVSLDCDLQDASYAQTVMRLLDDDDNYRIFVRAKNNNGEKLNELSDRIIYFGEEKKLYTHENIVNDDLTVLAQRINLLYNKTYSRMSDAPAWLKKLETDDKLSPEEQRRLLDESLSSPENREFMLEKWAELPHIEQASNLYHALNLPFKLNLLGFSMVKRRDENHTGITEEQFNEAYKNSGRESGYNDYSFFFKTESSNVLAYIEHSRWNALYILYDYKQLKKADMKVTETVEDGKTVKVMAHKNTAKKTHACITTYYGLHELIEYKYNTLYPDEKLSEKNLANNPKLQKLSAIYAYDYMDLDRLYSEITATGFVLEELKN